MLEIQLKEGNIMFPLLEVEPKIFQQKSKATHLELKEALEKWTTENNKMSEVQYLTSIHKNRDINRHFCRSLRELDEKGLKTNVPLVTSVQNGKKHAQFVFDEEVTSVDKNYPIPNNILMNMQNDSTSISVLPKGYKRNLALPDSLFSCNSPEKPNMIVSPDIDSGKDSVMFSFGTNTSNLTAPNFSFGGNFDISNNKNEVDVFKGFSLPVIDKKPISPTGFKDEIDFKKNFEDDDQRDIIINLNLPKVDISSKKFLPHLSLGKHLSLDGTSNNKYSKYMLQQNDQSRDSCGKKLSVFSDSKKKQQLFTSLNKCSTLDSEGKDCILEVEESIHSKTHVTDSQHSVSNIAVIDQEPNDNYNRKFSSIKISESNVFFNPDTKTNKFMNQYVQWGSSPEIITIPEDKYLKLDSIEENQISKKNSPVKESAPTKEVEDSSYKDSTLSNKSKEIKLTNERKIISEIKNILDERKDSYNNSIFKQIERRKESERSGSVYFINAISETGSTVRSNRNFLDININKSNCSNDILNCGIQSGILSKSANSKRSEDMNQTGNQNWILPENEHLNNEPASKKEIYKSNTLDVPKTTNQTSIGAGYGVSSEREIKENRVKKEAPINHGMFCNSYKIVLKQSTFTKEEIVMPEDDKERPEQNQGAIKAIQPFQSLDDDKDISNKKKDDMLNNYIMSTSYMTRKFENHRSFDNPANRTKSPPRNETFKNYGPLYSSMNASYNFRHRRTYTQGDSNRSTDVLDRNPIFRKQTVDDGSRGVSQNVGPVKKALENVRHMTRYSIPANIEKHQLFNITDFNIEKKIAPQNLDDGIEESQTPRLGPEYVQKHNCEDLRDSVFTVDRVGFQKQWSSKDQSLLANWGQIHQGVIKSIIINPEGTQIFTASSDGSLKQFNIFDRSLIKNWGKIHKGAINCMEITPLSTFQLTAGQDCSIKQWCLDKSCLFKSAFDAHSDWILSIKMHPDGERVFTCSTDMHLKEWSVKDSEDEIIASNIINEIYDYGEIHKYSITSLVITPDGNFLLTSGGDQSLKQWNIKDRILVHEFKEAHHDIIKVLACTPDSLYVFSGGDDKQLKQWSIIEGRLVRSYGPIHSKWVRGIVITKSGKFILTSSEDCGLKQFQIDNAKLVHDYGMAHDHAITDIAIMP